MVGVHVSYEIQKQPPPPQPNDDNMSNINNSTAELVTVENHPRHHYSPKTYAQTILEYPIL